MPAPTTTAPAAYRLLECLVDIPVIWWEPGPKAPMHPLLAALEADPLLIAREVLCYAPPVGVEKGSPSAPVTIPKGQEP